MYFPASCAGRRRGRIRSKKKVGRRGIQSPPSLILPPAPSASMPRRFFPSQDIVRMSYNLDGIQNTGTTFVKQFFSNSIYNPCVVAPQPTVVNLAVNSMRYNFYRVLAYDFSVSVTNLGADPVDLTLIHTTINPGTSTTAYAEYAEDVRGQIVQIPAAGTSGPSQTRKLRRSFAIGGRGSVVGTSAPLIVESYAGVFGTGLTPTTPSNTSWVSFGLETVTGGTLNCTFLVKQNMKVLVYDPIPQKS